MSIEIKTNIHYWLWRFLVLALLRSSISNIWSAEAGTDRQPSMRFISRWRITTLRWLPLSATATPYHADFRIEQMKNWDLLRPHFQFGEEDMACVMNPLAINGLLNQEVQLPAQRSVIYRIMPRFKG